jgi:hypothetical protein
MAVQDAAAPAQPAFAMFTKPVVVLASCLMLGGVAYFTGCSRQQPKAKPGTATTPAEPSAPSAAPVVPLTQPQRQAALEALAPRWEDAAMEAGADRQAKLQALCAEAVDQLGATDELAKFLQFLSTRGGAAQREWVLGPGLRELFAGPSAALAREQMLTVTDPATRVAICLRAGETCAALGFKKYLDSLAVAGHADCQSPVLAGRCITLARTDLAGAIYAFRNLKTSNINFVCLGQTLAEVFKDADYAGVKAALKSLPEDLRKDAVQGLCGHQGKSVGAYLAAIDELIQTAEWPKIANSSCIKLHNLTINSLAYDTLLPWADLLPERKDTEDLFRVAIRGCSIRQPAKAKLWIESLPQGWKHQNALAGYVQVSLGYRGDIPAARWALGQLTDPNFTTVADGFILEYEQRSKTPFSR